ncbi:MAG: hypothetical protein P8J32_05200, partial [bacterium]|nr:hypothetical protein [bacterium]
EPYNAAADSGTPTSSQPSSSTDVETSQVVPVREMLSPRPSNVEATSAKGGFEKIARTALCALFPRGIGSTTCRGLGAALTPHLMDHDLTLDDLGRSIHDLDRGGLHWRLLKQVNGEFPVAFVVRICGLGDRLRREDASETIH